MVNAVFLWLVNQLLDWGWPPFLTDDLEDLLPYVDVSLAATIAVNLVWAWRDPFWFRHAGQIALDVVSLVVAMRTWQLFPFDFTGYWSGWETVARVLIVVAIVGILVDIVVRAVALATGPRRSADLV